jgi:hypothetical protein
MLKLYKYLKLFLGKFLCYMNRHDWKLAIFGLVFSTPGEKSIDYRCKRCGKMKKGYAFYDGFRLVMWNRTLTDAEKKLLVENPYAFLKEFSHEH